MSETDWADWPTCDRCRRRRQTICPVCRIAGTRFQLAEYLVAPDSVQKSRVADSNINDEDLDSPNNNQPVQILLHCPECDEAFVPEFYRVCPECGHDAGHGIQIRTWQPQPLSDREFFVIVCLIATALAALSYFSMLFEN